MDIAKYIGLFLLKNNFCYLHGLGNLELKKKSARHDGEALHAPEYDVVLTPGGSIDDTLANYIATHEQTSISKAANALRDFSTATRAELAVGKDVEITGIGKFTEENGIVRFTANPHLKHVPPPVPMLRMSKRLEEKPDFRRDQQEHSSDADRNAVAWGKIALLGLLAIGIILAVVFGIRYFSASDSPTVSDTAAMAPPMQPGQTGAAQPATAAGPNMGAAGSYTIVLNTYFSRAAADRRAASLISNGNQVQVMSRDSGLHMVTLNMPGPVADTARMLDSLRAFFNPKGVRILR